MAQAGRDDAGHTGRAGSEVNVRARERTARRLLIAGAREGRAGADDDIYDAVRHAHADRASMQRRAQTVALRRVTLRRIDPISDPSLDLPPCPPPVGSRSPRHAREYLRPTTAARPGGCMGTKTNKPCPPHHRRSRHHAWRGGLWRRRKGQ